MKPHFLLPKSPYPSYSTYLAATGLPGLHYLLSKMPEQILEEVEDSGLRGRGGAGFPAGTKWRTLYEHPCQKRFVVCNAAEGEPGTFKDRYLLRFNPYACLEGLWLAAHVIQAEGIFIALKASFRKEILRVKQAIHEMREIFEEIPIEIIEGPEEYLFGEEKALLNFIEEGLPLPREPQYPPYEKGLFSLPDSPNPVLMSNTQTFAHIPSIVHFGGDSFRKLGTDDTPGTIIFTLSGDIKHPGVYERQAGISVRDILEKAGGGPRTLPIKVMLSGVSTGVLTPEHFDTPCDFGSLSKKGCGLGSAGFVFYDESRSMVRLAQAVARFLYVESCNQCTACKHGLRMASTAIDELFSPETAGVDDYERALYGAHSAPQANRCFLPVQGSLLIPSLMETFQSEFRQQQENPGREVPRIPLPLFLDFDDKKRDFMIDEKISQKNPDWTYQKRRVPKKRSSRQPHRWLKNF